MQHEITKRIPLLDEKGNIREPGYAKKLLWAYRRSDIKANPLRIKEWDYYLITNGRIGLALTIADNSYMSLNSISLLNFDEGWEITQSPMSFMTFITPFMFRYPKWTLYIFEAIFSTICAFASASAVEVLYALMSPGIPSFMPPKYLTTTTRTSLRPHESICPSTGRPDDPDGSPSSLARNLSPM